MVVRGAWQPAALLKGPVGNFVWYEIPWVLSLLNTVQKEVQDRTRLGRPRHLRLRRVYF